MASRDPRAKLSEDALRRLMFGLQGGDPQPQLGGSVALPQPLTAPPYEPVNRLPAGRPLLAEAGGGSFGARGSTGGGPTPGQTRGAEHDPASTLAGIGGQILGRFGVSALKSALSGGFSTGTAGPGVLGDSPVIGEDAPINTQLPDPPDFPPPDLPGIGPTAPGEQFPGQTSFPGSGIEGDPTEVLGPFGPTAPGEQFPGQASFPGEGVETSPGFDPGFDPGVDPGFDPTFGSGFGPAVGGGGGGGLFAPGVGASIDPALTTGAGGIGLTSPVGLGSISGPLDFVPTWLGGTGAALGAASAFAMPVGLALSQIIPTMGRNRPSSMSEELRRRDMADYISSWERATGQDSGFRNTRGEGEVGSDNWTSTNIDPLTRSGDTQGYEGALGEYMNNPNVTDDQLWAILTDPFPSLQGSNPHAATNDQAWQTARTTYDYLRSMKYQPPPARSIQGGMGLTVEESDPNRPYFQEFMGGGPQAPLTGGIYGSGPPPRTGLPRLMGGA